MQRKVNFSIGSFNGTGMLETPSVIISSWYVNNSNFSISYILKTRTPIVLSDDIQDPSKDITSNPTIIINTGAKSKSYRVLNISPYGRFGSKIEIGV